MAEKLRECPFCGGKAKLDDYSPTDGYIPNTWYGRVRCTVCGVYVVRNNQTEATAAWNRRTGEKKDG